MVPFNYSNTIIADPVHPVNPHYVKSHQGLCCGLDPFGMLLPNSESVSMQLNIGLTEPAFRPQIAVFLIADSLPTNSATASFGWVPYQ